MSYDIHLNITCVFFPRSLRSGWHHRSATTAEEQKGPMWAAFVVSVVLALYYLCGQTGKNIRLSKENLVHMIYLLTAAVAAMFPKTAERRVETLRAQWYVVHVFFFSG